jgi:hypothetical protein
MRANWRTLAVPVNVDHHDGARVVAGDHWSREGAAVDNAGEAADRVGEGMEAMHGGDVAGHDRPAVDRACLAVDGQHRAPGRFQGDAHGMADQPCGTGDDDRLVGHGWSPSGCGSTVVGHGIKGARAWQLPTMAPGAFAFGGFACIRPPAPSFRDQW